MPRSTRSFAGALLLGWGLFDLVEGIIDHHILAIHHVLPEPHRLLGDLLFLAAGAVLALAGGYLIHTARPEGGLR